PFFSASGAGLLFSILYIFYRILQDLPESPDDPEPRSPHIDFLPGRRLIFCRSLNPWQYPGQLKVFLLKPQISYFYLHFSMYFCYFASWITLYSMFFNLFKSNLQSMKIPLDSPAEKLCSLFHLFHQRSKTFRSKRLFSVTQSL